MDRATDTAMSECVVAYAYLKFCEATILLQWRSQDIAIARAQHGHTMFVRTSVRSAKAYRGVWGHPPRSVLRPYYTVAKCKPLTANSRMMSV